MSFRVRNTLLSYFYDNRDSNYSWFVFTTTETTVTTYNV